MRVSAGATNRAGWLLAAVVVLVLVGCGGAAVAPTATPAPDVTPAQILERTSRRLAETQTVHFELKVAGDTFVDSGNTIRLLTASGDLQRPDRVVTTFKVEVVGRTVSLQLITIGDTSWVTNILTGAWGPAPPEFQYQPTVLFDNQNGIGPVMGRVSDLSRLPDEEIDGRKVYRLQAQVDQDVIGPLTYYTIKGSPVTVGLWVDQQTDDLLRASMSEAPAADRPHPATWTLDLSRQGDKVSIEPPV